MSLSDIKVSSAEPPSGSGGDGGRPAVPRTGRLRPLGLAEVRITDGFWATRQETNRSASLRHIEHWLEREGWLGNFDAACEGRLPTHRRGREFSDTEVYKLLEAMAWETGRSPDPGLEKRFRAIVERVASAQHPDGYLNTNFGRPGQRPRYSDLEWGHELYCFGHLIQAAVARARTAGLADDLVRVGCRAADHVCEAFGRGGIIGVCGHPEIESALVELYRVTGHRRYLDQAELFVERRGHHLLGDIEFGRSYFQDDVPAREATVLRGHAVRATYLAAGAVDVAEETDDDELLTAVTRQWATTVARRTYITGGMGSRHQDEAFGSDFALPPDRAYSETCAGVGSVMLSWRLLLAQGLPEYADLIERTLYNVIATSPSWDGTRSFYTNTLHQRELGTVPAEDQAIIRAASALRAPWFEVSCCPTNVARLMASLGGYLATVDDDGLQIHQYASATVRTRLADGREIAVDIQSDYPRSGRVVVRVRSDDPRPWTLSLRVPSWSQGAVLSVDGECRTVAPGTANVTRTFRSDDVVVLDIPVAPRFTRPDPRIDAIRGCVAVERGPEVLCVESIDVPDVDHVDALRLDPTSPPREYDGDVIVRASVHEPPDRPWPYEDALEMSATDPTRRLDVRLLPYHDWANRGPSTMRVWLPTE
jgi:uncharacterized protein